MTATITTAKTETCPDCGDVHAEGIIAAYAASAAPRPGTTCPECPAPRTVARRRPTEDRAAAVRAHPRTARVKPSPLSAKVRQSTASVRRAVDTLQGAEGNLRPGQLEAKVRDYMKRHKAEAEGFTPTTVARALNRSSGAVANALRKGTAEGLYVLTNDRPKRYRWA